MRSSFIGDSTRLLTERAAAVLGLLLERYGDLPGVRARRGRARGQPDFSRFFCKEERNQIGNPRRDGGLLGLTEATQNP